MVTYTDAGGGQYEFELKGEGGGEKYVAAGLSLDEHMVSFRCPPLSLAL